MDVVLETLRQEFALADAAELTRLVTRLVMAIVLGGVIGFDRERVGKAAGLRTHMLVSLGSALFVLAGERAALPPDGMSRVIQGIVTGIGFLGGGAILKLGERREIHGLTTAASIWLTCGIGVCAGFGLLTLAMLVVVFALIVLKVLARIERRMGSADSAR